MPMWSFATAMREVERAKPTSLPRAGDRPPRCFLPLPPELSAPSNGPQPMYVYGFAVHEDFLADLASAARPRERMDGFKATWVGLSLLSSRTGATEAFLAVGKPARGQSKMLPTGVVPLVAVCTSALGSYKRRPSQEIMDRLTEMVGSKPRWWEAYELRKGERLEDVVCAVVA